MGFLDKLLGRSKDVADTAGDKAEDLYGDAKSHVTGGGDDGTSETAEAEQRLDDVRDQAMQDEGRIP